jgi:hypothetical protein
MRSDGRQNAVTVSEQALCQEFVEVVQLPVGNPPGVPFEGV